jgi:hypothetical protein
MLIVEIDMSRQPGIGAKPRSPDAAEPQLKPVALVQLIATVTLALSTLIVVTAVSIGLARAHVVPAAPPSVMTVWPVGGAT